MSNLMDPDGTNRIVKQRVSEWYAEIDAGRNAKLLEPESDGARWSLTAHARRLASDVAGRLSSLRHRPRASRDPLDPPIARPSRG